jgi:hypothetical protein
MSSPRRMRTRLSAGEDEINKLVEIALCQATNVRRVPDEAFGALVDESTRLVVRHLQ